MAGRAGRPRVAIIGAGFAGIGLGIQLKRAGFDSFTVLEKGGDVGGIWRDNTYPGLTCDVPSHLYSFSFEPKHDWSRRFPPQPEILDYLRGCARKYGLYDHMRFRAEVATATFDEGEGHWSIETTDGDGLDADVLVCATGQLSRPAYPRLSGLDRFEGTVFHSARWDHGAELDGKRVAAIGTGASAIQFVPAIAPRVGRLHLFQRSAPWVVNKPDRPYSAWERGLYRRVPWLQSASRLYDFLVLEFLILAFTRAQWLRKPLEAGFRRRLEREVADPRLRARVRPDYPMGCKRILLSSEWLQTIGRPNVELVTEEISGVGARGIVTADGEERTLDTIILGTGFQTNDFQAPMVITGLDGRQLNDVWRDGAEAYFGMTVSGFPNLFMLYGPNTNLGAGSVIFMMESQIHYVLEAVRALSANGARYMDLRREVQARFNAELQRRLEGTVWAQGCTSWYLTESGKNTNNWPGLTLEYRRRTRRIDPSAYRWTHAPA